MQGAHAAVLAADEEKMGVFMHVNLTPVLVLFAGALVYWTFSGSGSSSSTGPRHEISFQEFRSRLLAKVGGWGGVVV